MGFVEDWASAALDFVAGLQKDAAGALVSNANDKHRLTAAPADDGQPIQVTFVNESVFPLVGVRQHNPLTGVLATLGPSGSSCLLPATRGDTFYFYRMDGTELGPQLYLGADVLKATAFKDGEAFVVPEMATLDPSGCRGNPAYRLPTHLRSSVPSIAEQPSHSRALVLRHNAKQPGKMWRSIQTPNTKRQEDQALWDLFSANEESTEKPPASSPDGTTTRLNDICRTPSVSNRAKDNEDDELDTKKQAAPSATKTLQEPSKGDVDWMIDQGGLDLHENLLMTPYPRFVNLVPVELVNESQHELFVYREVGAWLLLLTNLDPFERKSVRANEGAPLAVSSCGTGAAALVDPQKMFFAVSKAGNVLTIPENVCNRPQIIYPSVLEQAKDPVGAAGLDVSKPSPAKDSVVKRLDLGSLAGPGKSANAAVESESI